MRVYIVVVMRVYIGMVMRVYIVVVMRVCIGMVLRVYIVMVLLVTGICSVSVGQGRLEHTRMPRGHSDGMVAGNARLHT